MKAWTRCWNAARPCCKACPPPATCPNCWPTTRWWAAWVRPCHILLQPPCCGGLFNLGPLSAVYHLQVFTPPALTPLAAQLMPWWKRRRQPPAPSRGCGGFGQQSIAVLLARPGLALYLRRRWLSLPETRPACRNLGLLLESLRASGGQRDFLLTFYEAYDRLCARSTSGCLAAPPSRTSPSCG